MNQPSKKLVKYAVIFVTMLILIVPVHVQAQRFVRAEGNVNLRDAPPHGLFYKFGNIIDVVRQGEKIRVVDEKMIAGIYVWLKIERLPGPSTKAKVGWVYNGEKGGKPYFIETKPE